MVVTGQNRSTRNVPVLLDWNRSRSSAVRGRHGPRYGPDVRNPIQSLLPVIRHQEVQSHIQWSAGVFSTGINRAESQTVRSFGLRGHSFCRLHFLEGLLIGEEWWMRFNLCRKTKISCQTFAVLCSKLINHFQTYQSTSTHTHTHHLTLDPSVHCSVDNLRTVVGGFLNRTF